jgi:hypothetical protein
LDRYRSNSSDHLSAVKMINQEIISFLKAALECSIYISPLDSGLTYDELVEIGQRAGYLQGEINDALPHVGSRFFGKARVALSDQDTAIWPAFFLEDPDYKDFDALDLVFNELNLLLRSEGEARAAIERTVLVERAIAKGIQRYNIEVAITWLVMAKMLVEKDGLRFAHRNGIGRQLPSTTRATHRHKQSWPNKARAHPFVKDVIARRSDGRPKHAEPLDAFAEELEKLGYRQFRMWWTQTVSELRQSNPSSTPVAVAVLAAALVEGALTFIVKHARANGQFQSKDYERDPRTWKIDELVASAASGGPTAILDLQSKARAETIIRTRQRIHAGRMLSDYPAGPPDLRPDEARDAKGGAEQVVRAVLDWLQKNPPSKS